MYILRHFMTILFSFIKKIFNFKNYNNGRVNLSYTDIFSPVIIIAFGVTYMFIPFGLTYYLLIAISIGSLLLSIGEHVTENDKGYFKGGILIPLLVFILFMVIASYQKGSREFAKITSIRDYYNGSYTVYEFSFIDIDGNKRILRKRSNDFTLYNNGKIIIN